MTQLAHTQLNTPLTHTQLAHTQLNSHNLSSHKLSSRGRRGTYGTGRALVAHRVLSSRRGRRSSLRGRRGTWRHPPSFHVAGMALDHIHIRFTWQAWHLRHWAGSGGAPGSQLTPWTPRLFAWQAWHLVTSTLHLVTSTFVSRGRRGTYGTGRALVAHRGPS